MNASQIRSELLGQHAQIRAAMESTRAAIESWHAGVGSLATTRVALATLASVVRSHNMREEELLRDVIPTVDPWGPVRAEIMDEEHVHEHDELYAALIDAGTARDAGTALAVVTGLLERLAAHMEVEERTFLGEDVLHEGTVLVEAGGLRFGPHPHRRR